MRKIILIYIFLLIPFLANSEIKIPFLSSTKIEVNVDSFTGETVVSSEWMDISEKSLWVKIIYKDDTEYIEMKYISGKQLKITPETPMLIQSSSGICKFTPWENYDSGIGNAAINGHGERFWGISAIYSGDLAILADNVKTVRITTLEGTVDFKLSKKTTKKLAQVYDRFAEAVKKVKNPQ